MRATAVEKIAFRQGRAVHRGRKLPRSRTAPSRAQLHRLPIQIALQVLLRRALFPQESLSARALKNWRAEVASARRRAATHLCPYRAPIYGPAGSQIPACDDAPATSDQRLHQPTAVVARTATSAGAVRKGSGRIRKAALQPLSRFVGSSRQANKLARKGGSAK